MAQKNKIILCTGVSHNNEDNKNQYQEALEKNGYQCQILQVLDFEFTNLHLLQECLADSKQYSGLILTSPRAVTSISLVIKNQNAFSIESWNDLPIFCIGKTTENMVKSQIGLKNIFGSDSGNSKNLSSYIINTLKSGCKPLLLPTSDIARETIPQTLSENGIVVKKLIVYKTKTCNDLKESINKVLNPLPRALTFFSPSTVSFVLKEISDQTIFEKLEVVAIGPTTNEALLEAGLKVRLVAEKPDPASLVEILKTLS